MFVMTTKAIFQMRRKHIFRQNFRKTCFVILSLVPAALFTSAEKMQSKSKYRRIAMVLLAILRERTFAVGNSSRAAFYLFVVARVGAVFPQFL